MPTTKKKKTPVGSSGKARNHVSTNGDAQKKVQARPSAKAVDLFLEENPAQKKTSPRRKDARASGRTFSALNVCFILAIAVWVTLVIRQNSAYGEFLNMRDAVDQQTFYEGTTIEGVDVSRMTLSNALDYWRDRVESRYAARTATLDNGMSVTAGELGYSSDYEAVLSAAWSAGRSGPLEQRYRMVMARQEHPAAYQITRADCSAEQLDRFAELVAIQVDREAEDGKVDSFDIDRYEFTFTDSQPGRKLDTDALKNDLRQAIASGGGNVALQIETIEPDVTTEEIASGYGLIDYAITNASSSSKARINNIKLALSIINGTRVASGETFSFNQTVGQRTTARGFQKATAYSGGEVTEQVGGGICQVSTTLFNAAVKADMQIDERHNHSLTVSYVDKGKDATVDWEHQDFRFTNTSDDDIIICCYLTEDKRVRFGIFGKLLPNGEKITVEAVTTEVIKYKTQYQPSTALSSGEMAIAQDGRNGYKAEAYKVRWDAQGNQLSRELLCKSEYKMKDEIILYGA